MLRCSCCMWILTAILLFPASGRSETGEGRFFLAGDGKIHIKHDRSGKEASVWLLNPDGSLNEEGLTRIDEVFGFPTGEKGEHMSLRLLFMLDHFSDLVAPGGLIVLTSGYRSPEYNSTLRDAGGIVAKTSIHMDGMALDFHIDGVKSKELWELIKSKNCCGAGYYGGTAIHLDAARPRYWEASTSKVTTGESDYNRRIYMSTDYDRYRPGDTVRLSFSSVSDFGFGIKPTVAFLGSQEGQATAATATCQLKVQSAAECIPVPDRKASHFLFLTLPMELSKGRYRVRVDFCNKPFEQMPASVDSNEIEVAD